MNLANIPNLTCSIHKISSLDVKQKCAAAFNINVLTPPTKPVAVLANVTSLFTVGTTIKNIKDYRLKLAMQLIGEYCSC